MRVRAKDSLEEWKFRMVGRVRATMVKVVTHGERVISHN